MDEIIKRYLVSLGFDVEKKGAQEFDKALLSAGKRVLALYTAIKVATAGVFYGISKMSDGFEELGYQLRLIAPSINRMLYLRNELLMAYRKAGVDLKKTVQQAVLFNLSLEKTKYALRALFSSVASRFFPLLTRQMDIFRKSIYDNMPKIQARLEKMIKFLFKAFEATVVLGQRVWSILGRVYEFFAKLHDATDGWSTVILAVIAAWRLLNLTFLASPLGLVLAGLVGILALYDDFKTFTEGGESFFNWKPLIPIINAVTDALGVLWDYLKKIWEISGFVGQAFARIFQGNFEGALESFKTAINGMIDLISKLLSTITGALGGVAGNLLNSLFSGLRAAAGLDQAAQVANGQGAATMPMIGGGTTNNSRTNQSVNQTTNINVTGSDAKATGAAVAAQQNSVNRNLTRNLKDPTSP